jgi:streptogramin lyase
MSTTKSGSWRTAGRPIIPLARALNPHGDSRSRKFLVAFPLLALFNVLTSPATGFRPPSPISLPALKPGDIIYADSGNAVVGGFIIKVDPVSGEQTVLSYGGNLVNPFGIAISDQGQLVVSDSSSCCRLILVDPATGRQSVVEDGSRQILGAPLGLAMSPDGGVLVANAQTLAHWDPATGAMSTISSNGMFVAPLSVAPGMRGDACVINQAFPAEILRVDLTTGAQVLLTRGGFLNRPQSIVSRNQDLYVTDIADPNGNVGIGRVIHIDSETGIQKVVSEGGSLVGPVGIALTPDGHIVVGDPYTTTPASPELFNGAIILINPVNGEQKLLACGHGAFSNPLGVAVVQDVPATLTH